MVFVASTANAGTDPNGRSLLADGTLPQNIKNRAIAVLNQLDDRKYGRDPLGCICAQALPGVSGQLAQEFFSSIFEALPRVLGHPLRIAAYVPAKLHKHVFRQ